MRLPSDQAAALERRQLASDARGRDAESLGEIEAAQPPVGVRLQLEQQREVIEAEAVMALERGVDVTHDDRAGVGELENGGKGGGCLGGGHISTISLICR